jgi:hypothetical protein
VAVLTVYWAFGRKRAGARMDEAAVIMANQ